MYTISVSFNRAFAAGAAQVEWACAGGTASSDFLMVTVVFWHKI